MDDFFDSVLNIWNDKGTFIPPMKLRELVVLNGDEYPIQVSLQSASGGGSFTVIVDIEISDFGGINPVIFTTLNNALSAIDVEASSEDPVNSTAVKSRTYNSMTITSPMRLPEHSICIIPLNQVTNLQLNGNQMSASEILTHSNRILADGCLREVHPVLWDYAKSTPAIIDNCAYTEIMKDFAMGYGSLSSGNVVICTADQDIVLYPNSSCSVVYCKKENTIIANQVQMALDAMNMTNNVDKQEFASAVRAVGRIAERQSLTTKDTQFVANNVVNNLPSVIISKLANLKNFNLASESAPLTGNNKIAKI
jgi:hypothetical protein